MVIASKLQISFFFLLLFGYAYCQKENSTDSPSSLTKAEREKQDFAMKYLFLCSSVIVVCIIRHLIRVFHVPVPYSLFCIIFGILWGVGTIYSDWMKRMAKVSTKSLKGLTYIYLPVTIFTIAITIDVHAFIKSLSQILIISGPVAFMSAVVTGLVMKSVIDPSWTMAEAVLFGIIFTTIYPIEALHCLKETTVHTKHVRILLEGETLITAAWVYGVYRFLISYINGWVVWWYQFVMGIVREFVLGVFLSYFCGLFGTSLMRLAYDSPVGLMTITTGICFTTFFFLQWIATSGIISTAMVGIIMGLERTSLPHDMWESIVNFFVTICYIINGILFVNVGVMTPYLLRNNIYFKDCIIVLVTYLVTNITRFLSFLIFAPCLSRMGYGMSFQNMMIGVWAGLKNPLCLTMALDLFQFFQEQSSRKSQIFFLHAVCVYMLVLLINGSCIPFLTRALGLTDLSISRQTNMNSCLKYIDDARLKTIAILKMDRFLADANWTLVMNSTTMKHPYSKTFSKENNTAEEDQDAYLLNKYTFCPDCEKSILNEPTAKELKEMTKEAKMRILKLKRSAYSRHFENGMLSAYGIRILHQAVDIAMDSKDLVIKLDGLFKLFTKEWIFYRFCKNGIKYLFKRRTGDSMPPRKQWRLWCHRLMNSFSFWLFMELLVILNLMIVSAHLIQDDSTTYNITFGSRFFFLIMYSMEFLIKIFALSWIYVWKHGVRNYFKSYWNIVEFSILWLTLFSTVAHGTTAGKESEAGYLDVILILALTIRTNQMLTVIQYCPVMERVIPAMIKYLNEKIDSQRALAFELGKSYILVQEEILENLHQIVDNDNIREEIKARIEKDRLAVMRRLGIAQKESPKVAVTVKTKLAMRTVLNSMKEDIEELKVSGWIDDVEYYRLLKSLAGRNKFINSIRAISPPKSKLILKEIPYMAEDENVVEFLYANVSTKKFTAGEVVYKQGDVVDAIYILISGMLVINYTPNKYVLEKMHETGALPVVDYICSLTYDEPMREFAIPGNTIGELSLLTGRPYNGAVSSVTETNVYVLNSAALTKAFDIKTDPVNGLECRIWKCLSFKKALLIMMNSPPYRSLTHEKIKYILERSFVPNLSNYKIFVVNHMMADIILVEGVVADFNSKHVYTAPCYIPRAVEKLLLPNGSFLQVPIKTKLLIIPSKGFDEYEIMMAEEDMAELIDDDSKLCLRTLIEQQGLIANESVKTAKYMKRVMASLRKKMKNIDSARSATSYVSNPESKSTVSKTASSKSQSRN